MGEPRELFKEEEDAIKAKAEFEIAEYKAKLAALPELCKIDSDIRKIRKMETGRAVKELGLVDKELDEIQKRHKGALLAYMKQQERQKSGRGNSHKVTPISQNLVLMMAAGDAGQQEIADVLGVCLAMVARKYREQLDLGKKLLGEGVECQLKFLSKLSYYDKGRTSSAHLYATNKSDIKIQGSIEHTGTGNVVPLVLMTDASKQVHDDVAKRAIELQKRPLRNPLAKDTDKDIVEGEIIPDPVAELGSGEGNSDG